MARTIGPVRSEDVHALSNFLRNHTAHVKRLRATGRPELLTTNGRASLVILDAAAYQRLFELADRMETLQSVREALDSLNRGEGISLETLDRSIKEKHGPSNPTGAAGRRGRGQNRGTHRPKLRTRRSEVV